MKVKFRSGEVAEVAPAKRLKGTLLRQISGQPVFRVYNKDGTFKDFTLFHSDLEIEIVGDDASLYMFSDASKDRLDHCPQTLGLENA